MKIPFHFKVLIGFILGILFGLYFKNDKVLEIKINEDVKIIKDIESISLCSHECLEFKQAEIKKEIINLDKKIKSKDFKTLSFKFSGREEIFSIQDIKYLKVKKNIYDLFEVIGKIFIRLLQMISVPLVVASLISGVGSIGDMNKFKKMAFLTFSFYFVSTVAAIVLGLVLVNLFKPGVSDSFTASSFAFSSAVNAGFDLKTFLIDMVPQNPFKAIAENNMLQIIFFSIFVGVVLNSSDKEKVKTFLSLTDTVSEIMIKIVINVMKIAPMAVFCLISSVIADAGSDMIRKMFFYMGVVIGGLLIYLFGFYSIYIKFLSKTSVFEFFKGVKDVMAVAFGTSSSAAALPVNFECCEQNLKVPKSVTGFVLPLGATVNMNGTAMYQAIAAVFIAQIYGINLSLYQQTVIVVMAVAAAVGSSPIPGVGIIMLVMILNSVNIPIDGIGIIIGVDRILDMFRTVVNVTGDSAACVIIKDRISETK
ncbi:MAG: dicarboxylate/amino acid:cation symporter [Elusimicrobia bacterium]|nr:dicarboxylate/amino acid:cation symporter [Elusimicrobiota bacterium]